MYSKKSSYLSQLRGTCWSLTINNPTESDMNVSLPAGWVVKGQPEQGEKTGTVHHQLMLTTPQVRGSAVEKIFPRAHIELARNKAALANYVNKEETRVGPPIHITSDIPTLFEYQGIIAGMYVEEECNAYILRFANELSNKKSWDELFMGYIDSLVRKDIVENGRRGAEFIGINPMWRSSWKLFGPQIISRHNIQNASSRSSLAQGDNSGSSASVSPAQTVVEGQDRETSDAYTPV